MRLFEQVGLSGCPWRRPIRRPQSSPPHRTKRDKAAFSTAVLQEGGPSTRRLGFGQILGRVDMPTHYMAHVSGSRAQRMRDNKGTASVLLRAYVRHMCWSNSGCLVTDCQRPTTSGRSGTQQSAGPESNGNPARPRCVNNSSVGV